MSSAKARTGRVTIVGSIVAALVMVVGLGFVPTLRAQGTLQDYQRAERFVAGNVEKMMHGLTLTPHWVDRTTDRFWFVEDGEGRDAAGGRRFVLVDPRSNSVQPAFDHARIVAALNEAMHRPDGSPKLVLSRLDDLVPGTSAVVTVDKTTWRCDLRRYQCEQAGLPPAPRIAEVVSPDGRWALSQDGNNLFVRDRRSGQVSALTTDGSADYGYGGKAGFNSLAEKLTEAWDAPSAVFSPDSKRIFTYRFDTRKARHFQLSQTVPGVAPIVHSYAYPLPGDPDVGYASFLILDIESGARVDVAQEPVPVAQIYDSLMPEQLHWSADGSRVYYFESGRGFKTTVHHAADSRTGKSWVLFEDRSDTYVVATRGVQAVGSGAKVVSTSERDGWNHLYLVDGNGGGVERQITSGPWVVFETLRVDERGGWIYFLAGGKEPGRDPYYRHLYRVALGGGKPQLLTPEDAEHSVTFAPSGEFFIDTHSRMDLAPVSVLRRADGRQLRVLQRADITQLVASGWRAPERFTVKSGDGRTDLYGVMFRPSNFDPARKYPVIDSVYPGPQVIATPKAFHPGGRNRSQELPLAELGFIVIVMDGKGSPMRSRAFHETQFGKLGYAGGLEDHIVAIKQLAARDPSLDIDRVGIFGHSAGAYATVRAMLLFPEFYKVAVASDGNHDLLQTWAAWGERYQGYPVDAASYEAESNASLAGRLQGKLLLVHGSLDDNTHPNNTLTLVDALIAANKDFDMLILPNRNHSLIDLGRGKDARPGLDPYFVRKRWDYFVRHLMGVTPPPEYAIHADTG